MLLGWFDSTLTGRVELLLALFSSWPEATCWVKAIWTSLTGGKKKGCVDRSKNVRKLKSKEIISPPFRAIYNDLSGGHPKCWFRKRESPPK